VPAGDANPAFATFFDARSDSEWTVTYTLTTSGLPEDVDAVEMTQYFGGAERLRTDVTAQGVESRTYMVDGKISVCTRMDEWFCFESTMEEDAQAEVEADIERGAYDATPLSSRTIAGTSASCFAFTTTGGGSGEYCFSAEGVPLLIKTGWDQMRTEMIATEYALSVPAGTWDVPESAGLPGGFDPSALI
jgi:hypothetical protein